MKTNSKRLWKRWLMPMFGLGFCALGHTASAACLAKPWLVTGNPPAQIIMIAPASQITVYEALGFQPFTCPSDMSAIRRYVDRLCSGGGEGPAGAINTTLAIGEPQEFACASAMAGLAEISSTATQ
jgi:hypothetical protein